MKAHAESFARPPQPGSSLWLPSSRTKSLLPFRLVVAAILLFVSSLTFAQSAGLGTISGVVVDATGAAVPGAAVIVANESKGLRRELTTNGDGVFTAPALTPDNSYHVTVSKTGFSIFEATKVTLAVGQTFNLRINLSVAASSTAIDVTSQAQLVEDAKTDVSQLVNSRQILDLPINGRRVDSFVLLTPGAVPDGTFGLISFRGVAGHNNFLTDGNDTTNSYYNENAGRTRIASQISQDAVQEFQVISNNFSAEYGHAMGGVVNTITKSGSNGLHGSMYWFFRNRTLSARDRYALINPPEWRHQVGGSIGGAIIKDKLFYFVNYEKTKRNFPLIASLTSGIFTPQGTLSASGGACGGPVSAANPKPATAAQCNAAIAMLTTRNFGTITRSYDQDLALAKLDYILNQKNTLTLSLNYLRWVSPHGIQTQAVLNDGNGIGNNADSTVRTRYGLARLTTIVTASAVNEARFGWFKDKLFDPASADFLYPGLGSAGLSVNSTSNLGVATSYPRLNPSEQRFQFADNLNWTLGKHTVKFGVDIDHVEDYQDQLSNQFGSFTYNTLNAFALDFSGNATLDKNWTSYSQRFGTTVVDTNVSDFGFYVQDSYHMNSRLLVNLGVRYDYAKLPQPTLVNPDYPTQTGRIPSAKDNFAPRAGLSYVLDKSRKTLFRAGYGIFYSRYQTGLVNTLFVNNNIYQKSITYQSGTAAQLAAGPVYPNFLPSTNFSPAPGSTSITWADQNLRNPYTHQANIGIERELTNNLGLTVSYVWSRGVRLYGVRDLNIGPLGSPQTYNINDASGNKTSTFTLNTYRGPRADPRYQRILQVENPGLSYYDGLIVQLNRRFTKGLQASANYTWSHSIDFNQSGGSNNIFFSGSPSTLYNGDFSGEKGSAANDTRQRFVGNFVYSPTFTKSNSWVARYLVNNWQLSGIMTLQSAQSFNSSVSASGAVFAGALYNGSLNGSGGSNRVPFEALNNLQLDPITRFDGRIARKLPFSERVVGYLQFEAFNVTNTPYDTSKRSAHYNVNNVSATNPIPSLTPRSDYGSGSASQAFPDGTNARRAQVSLRVVF